MIIHYSPSIKIRRHIVTLPVLTFLTFKILSENSPNAAFTILLPSFSFFYILATPLFLAASATAFATVFPTLSSNAFGIIYSSLSSSYDTSPAIA